MAEAELVNLDPVLRPQQTRKYFEAKWKVLIVEDDRLMGQMLTMILDDMGFEVTTANNGITAFAKLQQQPLDFTIPSPKISEKRAIDYHAFLIRPKTKAQETTARGYNNRFAVFKPMFRQNYAPSIELYRAGRVSDDRAGDDAGYLPLDRARGELPDHPTFLQQHNRLGESELGFHLASSSGPHRHHFDWR
jgi:CheY-like chemotaxis protein